MQKINALAAILLPVFYSNACCGDMRLLCEKSSRGQQTCLHNLQAFIQKTGDEPLTDDELYRVFGCLQPTGIEDTARHQQKFLDCEPESRPTAP